MYVVLVFSSMNITMIDAFTLKFLLDTVFTS